MDVRLLLVGSENVHDELSSLCQWLGQESEFRGRVRLDVAAIRPGEMGGLAEALTVAAASGGALTVLAGSISAWLQQRRSVLSVKIVNSDGSSHEITASGPVADTFAANIEPHQHG